MKKKLIIILPVLLFIASLANAQHYVGLKNAYGMMNVSATPSLGNEGITTAFNPGVVYRYEHKKYFAFQTELNYLTKGYKIVDSENNLIDDQTHKIHSYELPILAQGFVRFGWFRPYLTGGVFVGYIDKRKLEINGKTDKYEMKDYDKRFEYGILGGAGMAFSISRFELQTEWRYQYAFSFLQDPHINAKTQYINATQMMISLTLLYRLGK